MMRRPFVKRAACLRFVGGDEGRSMANRPGDTLNYNEHIYQEYQPLLVFVRTRACMQSEEI